LSENREKRKPEKGQVEKGQAKGRVGIKKADEHVKALGKKERCSNKKI